MSSLDLHFMTLRSVVEFMEPAVKRALVKAICVEESIRTKGTPAHYAWNRVSNAVDEAEREEPKMAMKGVG